MRYLNVLLRLFWIILQISLLSLCDYSPSFPSSPQHHQQGRQLATKNHIGEHERYKNVVHNLGKANNLGNKMDNLVELSTHYGNEIHGLMGRMGQAERKIVVLGHKIEDIGDIHGISDVQQFYRDLENIKQRQDELERNGNGGQALGGNREEMAEIERKLQQHIEAKGNDIEEELKRTERNLQREIDTLKDGRQENQTTIKSDFERFRDEIERKLEGMSPRVESRYGGNVVDDVEGVLSKLASRVDQIEHKSGGSQNVEQKYEQIRANMEEEERRLRNEIEASKMERVRQTNEMNGKMASLEQKMNSIERGKQPQQQMDRNTFEAMLRQSQEMRRNIELAKKDMSTEMARKIADEQRKQAPNVGNRANELETKLKNSEFSLKKDIQAFRNELDRQKQLYNSLDQELKNQKLKVRKIDNLENTMNQRQSANNNNNNNNQQMMNQRQIEEIRREMKNYEPDWKEWRANKGRLVEHSKEIGELKRANNESVQRNSKNPQDFRELLKSLTEIRGEMGRIKSEDDQKFISQSREIKQLEQNLANFERKFGTQENELSRHKDMVNGQIRQQMESAMYSVNNGMGELERKQQMLGEKIGEEERKQAEMARELDELRKRRNHQNEMERQKNDGGGYGNSGGGQGANGMGHQMEQLMAEKTRDVQNGMAELSRKMESMERVVNRLTAEKMTSSNREGNSGDAKYRELSQRMDMMERRSRNNEQQQSNSIPGKQQQQHQLDLDRLKARFDTFEKEFVQTFGWKMKNFTDMQKRNVEMQRRETELVAKLKEKMDRMEMMERKLANWDGLVTRVERMEALGRQWGANNNPYGQQGSPSAEEQQRKNKIGKLELRMEKLERDRQMGTGGTTTIEWRRELEEVRGNVEAIKIWKGEMERRWRNNVQNERNQNAANKLENINLDQLDSDLRAFNRMRPKMEMLEKMEEEMGGMERRINRVEKWEQNKFPDMRMELERVDGEVKRHKLELENVERLKGEIGKLQQIEREALKTLEGEFEKFNAIREILRTVDFAQLERDIREFNGNKYRLQNVEMEMKKFPELDTKIQKVDHLERNLNALGNMGQIVDRMDRLENRLMNGSGGGGGQKGTNGPLGSGGGTSDYLLNRVKAVEEGWRKLDGIGLENVPTQLRRIEREGKVVEEKVKTLEDFQQDARRFIGTESRKMAKVEEKMAKFDALPDKVATLETNLRWQNDKVQRHEIFVNNFGNLGDDLKRLKRIDDDWAKFDDVQKFVGRVAALEVQAEKQRAKMELIDWLHGEWQKFPNLQQDLVKLRTLEREMAKLGNADELAKNMSAMRMDMNSLKIQFGNAGNSAALIGRLDAVENELKTRKMAANQLAADIEGRFHNAETAINNWAQRIGSVEKLAEEMENVKNAIEPHRAKLQRLDQHWGAIEGLGLLENGVRVLETNMRERTLRIQKLEELVKGIDNLGSDLAKVRKLDSDLRMMGGLEQIQNRLLTLETKNRGIETRHQTGMEAINGDIKALEEKMRKLGNFDQFLANVNTAQRDLVEMKKKYTDFQAGMRNFDQLIVDLRQVQKLENELKKVRNINQFLGRIGVLEGEMESQRERMEKKEKAIDDKITLLGDQFGKELYNMKGNMNAMNAQMAGLKNVPQQLRALELADLPVRTKTLEDKMDALNSFRRILENDRNLFAHKENIDNLNQFLGKVRAMEEKMKPMDSMKMKMAEMELDMDEMMRKYANANNNNNNNANPNVDLEKMKRLEERMRKVDGLANRLKLLEEENGAAMYKLKLEMGKGMDNVDGLLSRMGRVEEDVDGMKKKAYSGQEEEEKRREWEELKAKVGNVAKAQGKLRHLDELDAQLYAINKFGEEVKKYGSLGEISAKIDGIQYKMNSLESAKGQLDKRKNVNDLSQKMDEMNYLIGNMQKRIGDVEQFRRELPNLREEMHSSMGNYKSIEAKQKEMQKLYDALKYYNLSDKMLKIEQIEKNVKALEARHQNMPGGGLAEMRKMQNELNYEKAKVGQVEKEMDDLRAKVTQIQRMAGDLKQFERIDGKLKEIEAFRVQVGRLGNVMEQLEKIKQLEGEFQEMEKKMEGNGGIKERANQMRNKIDYEIEDRLRSLEKLGPSSAIEDKRKIKELEESLEQFKSDFYRQNGKQMPSQQQHEPPPPYRSPLERMKNVYGGNNSNNGGGGGGGQQQHYQQNGGDPSMHQQQQGAAPFGGWKNPLSSSTRGKENQNPSMPSGNGLGGGNGFGNGLNNNVGGGGGNGLKNALNGLGNGSFGGRKMA